MCCSTSRSSSAAIVAKALPWKTYDEALKAAFNDSLQRAGNEERCKGRRRFLAEGSGAGRLVERGREAASPSAPENWRAVRRKAPRRNSMATPANSHFISCRSPRRCCTTARSRICRGCRKRPTRSRASCGARGSRSTRKRRPSSASSRAISLEVASQHGTLERRHSSRPGSRRMCVAMPIGQGHDEFHALCKRTAARIRFRFSRRSPSRKQARSLGPRPASRFRASAKAIWFCSAAACTETPPELKHR